MTGAGGLLGSEFVRLGGDGVGSDSPGKDAGQPEIIGLTRGDLDVTDGARVAAAVAEIQPDWIVHCAAYTAVDHAEDEPDEAMRVNHGGTVAVAAAAARRGARLAYISTDYVFDGRKGEPYQPSDPTAPRSVYARTKRAGELAALVGGGVAIRLGWLYGGGGGNFVDAILRRAEAGESLSVVDDQRGRPTWARNAARVSTKLLRVLTAAAGTEDGGDGATAVWHVADGGSATWLELAREALRLRGLDVDVRGVSTGEWGAAAARPAYSVLDLSATEAALGESMMPWKEALYLYLRGSGRPSP